LETDLHDPQTAFAAGKEYQLNPVTVSREEIIEFAAEFDPAPFHLDDEAAKASLLGGLSASGFHTCALSMKMICDSYLLRSTSQGSPEVEEIKWLAPVQPGDTISGKSVVLEGRRSASRPNLWITRLNHQLQNQKGVPVLSMIVVGLFAIREPAA
jgi:acyl dehydratase